MKKLIGMLALVAGLCMSVQSQTVTNTNPLNVARAFALKTPTHFHCNMSGVMMMSNTMLKVSMQFEVRKIDFAIIALTYNGVQIPLPEPIFGLPLMDGLAIRDLWMNVAAETKNHEHAGSAYLNQRMVQKNDCLTVTIRPADLRHEIPLPDGVAGNDILLRLVGFDGGYGWGESNGKFYLYLPPIGGKYNYTLTKWSDGTPLGGGVVEPFMETVTPNSTYLGFEYEGGVLGAEFQNPAGNEDWIGYPIHGYKCQIPIDNGGLVAGAVYFLDADVGGLEVVLSGNYFVYVQKAIEDNGPMPFFELYDNSATDPDGYSETRVKTKTLGVGKVVVTIVPKDGRQDTWINFHRFYNMGIPPVVGGGGGGGGTINEI